MDPGAAHVGFVVASYAISAILLVGLVIYIFARDRNLRAEAIRLDEAKRSKTP